MPPGSCHLALSYWNRLTRRYEPLPDGVEVLARDADPLTRDDTIGSGRITGGRGQVCVSLTAVREAEPELYFQIDFGERVIELSTGRLRPAAAADEPVLELPKTWTTRNRYAVSSYERGLWTGQARPSVGSPGHPVEFRITFDAFVRFVQWSEAAGDFVGAPEGTEVRLIEHDLLDRTVLARDRLDDHGRALLSFAHDIEHQPDLSLELSRGGDAWSSREHLRHRSLTERGYWEDYVGTRIGRWGSPYTFDLSEGAPPRVLGNRARALIDGPEILAAMRDAIASARRSIHLEVMLWYDDPCGRAIRDLLLQRAREGIEVRLLFDHKTTASSDSLVVLKQLWVRGPRKLSPQRKRELLEQLAKEREAERIRGDTSTLRPPLEQQPGITLLDSSFPYVQVAPRAVAEEPEAYEELRQALPFFSVARIDHRKLMVVDGQRALLGGANIGHEYMYERPFDPRVPAEREEWAKWHDCFVEIEGPAVAGLQARFRERWVAEGGDAFDLGSWGDPHAPAEHPYFPALTPRPDGIPISILDTTPGARLHVHEQLLGLIAAAEREVLLENPYFSSREVLRLLCQTARRGVRVVCVFPDEHNDSWDFLYAARLKYPAMLEAGIEVYEYDNHMTHAKVAVIDDVAIIGSANLNHASFFNHYELVAVMHDAAFTRDFRRRLFEHDLQYSRRIAPQDVEGLLDIEDWVRGYLRYVVDGWY